MASFNESEAEANPMAVNTDDGVCEKPHKKEPKRILYFSDGTLEEYSTDEEDTDSSKKVATVDPGALKWVPWFWYQTVFAGSKVLHACDYMGESLASFFGILTPKYQSEIDHFEEIKAEEEATKKEEDLEMGSWKNKSDSESIIESQVKNTQPLVEERQYGSNITWTHEAQTATPI